MAFSRSLLEHFLRRYRVSIVEGPEVGLAPQVKNDPAAGGELLCSAQVAVGNISEGRPGYFVTCGTSAYYWDCDNVRIRQLQSVDDSPNDYVTKFRPFKCPAVQLCCH